MTPSYTIALTFSLEELARDLEERRPNSVFFDDESRLDKALEAIPGYVRHNFAHSQWIQVDLETDDFNLAAIHSKTVWRLIEKAFRL
jgi:hypothetical protein